MDSECEKPMNSTDTLIEAKLSKVSKAFSIENLIAKNVSDTVMENGQGNYLQHQSKIPPIAFPFYNPWAANYLMSHTNLPQNLLQLNSNPQHLQGDKLSNLPLDAQGFVYKDFLLNPLLNISHEQSATYQLQQHDPTVFAHKLKDTQFLNEFYTNYFMLENNRLLANNTSDKRTKKDFNDECNNDSNNSDFDVVNERDKSENKNGIYYEEDSSYSDLSVTMSPGEAKNDQNKGRGIIMADF